MTAPDAEQTRTFGIQVLGRTLEHLGTQMYKRRDVAIIELVANAWDAGATNVAISVPTPTGYSMTGSAVVVTDNGTGMTADQVDDEYLVIGRNRRASGQTVPKQRRVMGRKGVGKLAGFGLGRVMRVLTWREGTATEFALDGALLKAEGGQSRNLEIPGVVKPAPSDIPFPSGTRVEMTQLKHKTPPDIDGLHRSLARRFSRTVTGEMAITINDEPLRDLVFDLELRWPAEGTNVESLATAEEANEEAVEGDAAVTAPEVGPASDGAEPSAEGVAAGDTSPSEPLEGEAGPEVTWWAGFSKKVLPSELQGFTVMVHGKTAQAPPFFFGVEGTASGQHGTKYLTGVIEADFLDDGNDDDSDRISTDRQEIDWEDESALRLRLWGDALTRRLLRERSALREESAVNSVKKDAALQERIDRLDGPSKKQAEKFIRALGRSEAQSERVLELAGTIVRAFEYRQFHDYIDELDEAMDDPIDFGSALEHLHGWKVLESRAILEVVQGRINIVEKFFKMIVNDASETAHVQGNDNLHDLIARYPWLIDPEWQVLAEEKTITRQLREWGEETSAKDNTRYDFIGLTGEGQTVIIEIKRGDHAATVADLQQLERYVEKLSVSDRPVRGAFITGKYQLSPDTERNWRRRDDIALFTWGGVHERTAKYYRHYKAVLDNELGNGDFDRKAREVAMTRTVLTGTSWRTPEERAAGLGPQDVDYTAEPAVPPATDGLDEPVVVSAPADQSAGAPPSGGVEEVVEGGVTAPNEGD